MTSFVFHVVEASRIAAGKITERSARQHDKNNQVFSLLILVVKFDNTILVFDGENFSYEILLEKKTLLF